jgi:Uma2 family endonuclease
MAVPEKKPFITPEEYLRLEREAEYKSEYYDGEIFAMAGTSITHSLITANVLGELRGLLRGGRCTTYDSNLKIKVSSTGLYTYPDASVICGPVEHPPEGDDMALNPTLIVEVLSDSTEAYNRGRKFEQYRSLPSFREYVLVSQKEPLVETFFRQPEGNWLFSAVRGLDETVRLHSLAVDLRLSEVYLAVEFPADKPAADGAAT